MKIVYEGKVECIDGVRTTAEDGTVEVYIPLDLLGTVTPSDSFRGDPKAKVSKLQGGLAISPIFAKGLAWGSKLKITVEIAEEES